jgi:hypothetical protein
MPVGHLTCNHSTPGSILSSNKLAVFNLCPTEDPIIVCEGDTWAHVPIRLVGGSVSPGRLSPSSDRALAYVDTCQ